MLYFKAQHLPADPLPYLTPHRWSRHFRQCSLDIQKDASKRIAGYGTHHVLCVFSLGIHGCPLGLWQGVQLVRQYDLRRGSFDLVRHLLHVSSVLCWHEGPRNRPQDLTVLLSSTAFRGVVCRHQLSHHLSGACPVAQYIPSFSTSHFYRSSVAGRCFSGVNGPTQTSSQTISLSYCSRYCISPRSFGRVSPSSQRHRWISILDWQRSRQVLMMSLLQGIGWKPSGRGW